MKDLKVLKYLKPFNNYKSELYVSFICKKFKIKNWSISSDELIDVDGDVDLSEYGLDKLPLKFGRVTGDFNCNHNNLINLEGSPKYIGGYFYIASNKLVNLEGAPVEVGGDFNCEYNQLTSLKGGPEKVGGDFNCNHNNLISLEGSPKYVGGYFQCDHNKLVSFEGAPDFIGGVFICDYNPISRIWKLFEDYSKIELFNYYDIVRELDGKPAIILARLNQFLEDVGKSRVDKINGYINI